MKAKLLVNLKTNKGVVDAGTVYDDEVAEFPSHITDNIDNPKIVYILPVVTPAAAPATFGAKAPAPAKAPAATKPKLAVKAKG